MESDSVSERSNLSEELTRFGELRQSFLGNEGDMSDAAAIEVLEGILDLHAAIVAAARSALDDEAAASRIRGRMDEMEARLRRVERRAEDTREMALRAMAEAGLEKLDAPGLQISLRHAPPQLVISDESLVPATFRVEQRARLDYQSIRDALKAGMDIPGATLADPEPYLSLRTS